jgi:aerobic carbon-monoxide dehydrogenase medium subunit
MLLPKFDFHDPTTVEEACRLLAQFGIKAKPLAGGTDLMVNMKEKIVSPGHVVSLSRIEALKQARKENGCYSIGACVTVAELIESESIQKDLPALVCGSENLGTPLIRNLATIGGNIGSARPAADLPLPLMAYDARVILESTKERRTVPLNRFFLGPGLTEIRPDEILCHIEVDIPSEGAGAGYLSVGVRKAQDCNLVNVAAFLALEDDRETIKSARIIMGCVGPTPLRSPSAEEILIGKKAAQALFAEAGRAACSDSRPVDDFRGSAHYKRAMVGVLTRRTLSIALNEAMACR